MQGRVQQRKCCTNSGDLQRVPFKLSAEYWSAHVYEETTQGGKRIIQKNEEGEISVAFTGQEIVPVATTKEENLIIHRASERVQVRVWL